MMNNSYKMNAYNFRNIDKSIKPVNDPITKQQETGPNVLRMVFSSSDNVNTTTTTDANNNVVVTKIGNQPIFNVNSTIFNSKFDSNRPVYFYLDYCMNNSTDLAGLHNIVWLNMPNSNSCWYTNNTYKNIIGSSRGQGTSLGYGVGAQPFMTDINLLCSMSRFEFAFVTPNHALLPLNSCDVVIMAIIFYQL